MKKWQTSEARAHLSELLEQAQHEPQLIMAHGKPYAVVTQVDQRLLSKEGIKEGKMAEVVKKLASLKTSEPDSDLPTPPKKTQKPRKVDI